MPVSSEQLNYFFSNLNGSDKLKAFKLLAKFSYFFNDTCSKAKLNYDVYFTALTLFQRLLPSSLLVWTDKEFDIAGLCCLSLANKFENDFCDNDFIESFCKKLNINFHTINCFEHSLLEKFDWKIWYKDTLYFSYIDSCAADTEIFCHEKICLALSFISANPAFLQFENKLILTALYACLFDRVPIGMQDYQFFSEFDECCLLIEKNLGYLCQSFFPLKSKHATLIKKHYCSTGTSNDSVHYDQNQCSFEFDISPIRFKQLVINPKVLESNFIFSDKLKTESQSLLDVLPTHYKELIHSLDITLFCYYKALPATHFCASTIASLANVVALNRIASAYDFCKEYNSLRMTLLHLTPHSLFSLIQEITSLENTKKAPSQSTNPNSYFHHHKPTKAKPGINKVNCTTQENRL